MFKVKKMLFFIVYKTDYGKSAVYVVARNKREAITAFKLDYSNEIMEIVKIRSIQELDL